MNLFDQPVPLSQAIKVLQAKGLLPTDLTSAEIRQLNQAIRNQSLLSAQTLNTDLLQKYKDVLHKRQAAEDRLIYEQFERRAFYARTIRHVADLIWKSQIENRKSKMA